MFPHELCDQLFFQESCQGRAGGIWGTTIMCLVLTHALSPQQLPQPTTIQHRGTMRRDGRLAIQVEGIGRSLRPAFQALEDIAILPTQGHQAWQGKAFLCYKGQQWLRPGPLSFDSSPPPTQILEPA